MNHDNHNFHKNPCSNQNHTKPNNVIQHKKSYMQLEEIFFWTATIHNWQPLLLDDKFKDVIINSLRYLSKHGLIDVNGFVIMPTPVHFIWKANGLNGKESPQGSFLKFTAHCFLKLLKKKDPDLLQRFRCVEINKLHEFWQRDPLAINLYTKKVALQKLNYIHKNPVSKKWRLANDPILYKYSSANFYETGEDAFGFLKNIYEAI